MKYCADTWFILEVFEGVPKAINLINETRTSTSSVIIPIIVYSEAIKKLMQKGFSDKVIEEFFFGLELSKKINFIVPYKEIAKEAVKISLTNNLPLIDSFVAATSKLMECDILLAKDSDYKILEKKKYLKIMNW